MSCDAGVYESVLFAWLLTAFDSMELNGKGLGKGKLAMVINNYDSWWAQWILLIIENSWGIVAC